MDVCNLLRLTHFHFAPATRTGNHLKKIWCAYDLNIPNDIYCSKYNIFTHVLISRSLNWISATIAYVLQHINASPMQHGRSLSWTPFHRRIVGPHASQLQLTNTNSSEVEVEVEIV